MLLRNIILYIWTLKPKKKQIDDQTNPNNPIHRGTPFLVQK